MSIDLIGFSGFRGCQGQEPTATNSVLRLCLERTEQSVQMLRLGQAHVYVRFLDSLTIVVIVVLTIIIVVVTMIIWVIIYNTMPSSVIKLRKETKTATGGKEQETESHEFAAIETQFWFLLIPTFLAGCRGFGYISTWLGHKHQVSHVKVAWCTVTCTAFLGPTPGVLF